MDDLIHTYICEHVHRINNMRNIDTMSLSPYRTQPVTTGPCAKGGRSLRLRSMAAIHPAHSIPASSSDTKDGTQYLRPHLLKLAAYTPIEPFEILSARYGRQPEDIVKLDANENPYGPPPEVREALAKMPFPHIYPDPETRQLRKALSEMNDIPIEHLLVCFGYTFACMHCTVEMILFTI